MRRVVLADVGSTRGKKRAEVLPHRSARLIGWFITVPPATMNPEGRAAPYEAASHEPSHEPEADF